jgi:ATP-dependent Clp protease, protease subunit
MDHHAFARASRVATAFRGALGKKPLAAKSKDGRGALYIYAPIGDSMWGDSVSAQAVVDKLAELADGGAKSLDVYINSEGGSVWDGKAIYEAICRFNGEKVVHIDGLAASAASFIAMAGDKIVCAPAATMMIHDAWGLAIGNAADLRSTADVLEMESGAIAGIYAKRTGRALDEVKQMMGAETWMNAEKAKELGFCDEIRGEAEEKDDAGAEQMKSPLKIVNSILEAQHQRVAASARRARLPALK